MSNDRFDQLSEENGYGSGDGGPKRDNGIHHTSFDAGHFYAKSFSKFNMSQSWLCKHSFFCQISQKVLLLLSGKCQG